MTTTREPTYLLFPSEEIQAKTPVEFRQLLNRIRELAGLTSGQISVKTTIPRSQAYSLISTSRATLPSKPDQVREFVQACGLSPIQTHLVMDVWDKLDTQTKEDKATTFDTSSSHNRHLPKTYPVNTAPGAPHFGVNARSLPSQPQEKTIRREKRISDLLFLVLHDRTLVRHAILLMLPVALTVIVIVVALIVWAILQPNNVFIISPLILMMILLPFAVGGQQVRRRQR